MIPDYLTLIQEHNEHSLFLDHQGLMKAMDICYKMGKSDGNIEVLNWLSNMDYLSDNIVYIKEEWENQNGKNDR